MFEWALHVIESGGYGGVFFLMVLENIFPIHPIPSELILLFAGFVAAKGTLHVVGIIFVATCGAVLGSIPWYMLGRAFGTKRLKQLSARYGRMLTLSPHDIDVVEAWFERHGQKTVLIGRMMPAVRTLISVPAGIAHMPFGTFLLYSFIGSAVWTAVLTLLGYILQSQYAVASGHIEFISEGVVLLIVLVYIYRVITFRTEDAT